MQRYDVIVVGGGVAALTAAARAAAEGATVLVVEGPSPDGRAATDQRHGFALNRGAHALYDAGPGRAVLDRLGVAVRGAPPPLAGALGVRGDVVDRLPVGAGSAATTRLVSLRDKAQLAAVLAGARRWNPEDLAARSTAAWMDDLGLGGGARQLFELLVRLASYATDHHVVSADVAATQLRTAGRGVTYLHGGWATMARGLRTVARRHGAAVVRATATAVEPLPDGGALVDAGGDRFHAGAVVLAVGTPAACAALLPEAPAAWRAVGPRIAASCLDLGLDHVPAIGTLLGVDRPLYLIRHAPPAQLAPDGCSVVHALAYRSLGVAVSPAEQRRRLEDHARLAGIDPAGAVVARYLHDMTVVSAAATPELGGLAGRPGVASSGHRSVLVAGDWVGPVGHLVDASLASGDAAGAAASTRRRSATVAVAASAAPTP